MDRMAFFSPRFLEHLRTQRSRGDADGHRSIWKEALSDLGMYELLGGIKNGNVDLSGTIHLNSKNTLENIAKSSTGSTHIFLYDCCLPRLKALVQHSFRGWCVQRLMLATGDGSPRGQSS